MLKLYVWGDVLFPRPGARPLPIAFALAESVDRARDLILVSAGTPAMREIVLGEIQGEPTSIHTFPVGYSLFERD